MVGIVVAKSGGTTSDGTTIEGLGFAIPIDDVKEVVQELSTNGYVTGRPSLGVNLVDITNEQTAMMYRVNQLGVYVLKSTKPITYRRATALFPWMEPPSALPTR